MPFNFSILIFFSTARNLRYSGDLHAEKKAPIAHSPIAIWGLESGTFGSFWRTCFWIFVIDSSKMSQYESSMHSIYILGGVGEIILAECLYLICDSTFDCAFSLHTILQSNFFQMTPPKS